MKKVISLSQTVFNIEEVKRTIPKDYLIVFYCPVEWIDEIGHSLSENYKNSIGCSSFKDVTANYCEYNSVSFIGIEFQMVKLYLFKDVSNKIISYYKEISSLKNIYRKDYSVLIEFTDGLSLAEESVLTVITNELEGIPVVGGSAADSGNFSETKVCVNGECASNATALCMLTTPMQIDIYCENIYKPTNIKGIITDSELFERKIHKINGKTAVDFYCEKLNISRKDITDMCTSHPFARLIGDRYFVTSIMGVDEDSFNVYCRTFKNSYITICDPIDYEKLWNRRMSENNYKYIGGIFVNCIFRTNLFEKDNSMHDFQNYLSSYGDFICMTSYGEQFCDSHANQTMTCCLFKA